MSNPLSGAGGPPGPPPVRPVRRRGSRRGTVIGLTVGAVVLLLVGLTVLNYHLNEQSFGDKTVAEELAEVDEYDVSHGDYADTVVQLAEFSAARSEVGKQLSGYYVELTKGDTTPPDLDAVLADVDEARERVEDLPASGNPQVAEITGTMLDHYEDYRAEVDAVRTDAEALNEAPQECVPAAMGSLDVVGAQIDSLLTQCRRAYGAVAKGASGLARAAGDGRGYLLDWKTAARKNNLKAADEARSAYLLAYTGAIRRATTAINRMDEMVDGDSFDLTALCNERAFVPAGT